MLKRIDQILSSCGYCSRNDAKKWAKKDRIRVGDTVIRDASQKAEPSKVILDNEPLDHPDGIFIMMNKPAGYVCSHESDEGARVYDLLPEIWQYRNPVVSTIGRLDKDTTGIILVTDQTRYIHDLTSPKKQTEKVYRVKVEKPLKADLIDLFASGTMMLDDEEKPCAPGKLTIIDEYNADLSITEGRYHQVKRMFATVNNLVVALHRWKFGPYLLDSSLPEGKFIDLPLPQ